ncbi:MAG: hypothetical protein RLZZ140_958 [Pseudomonadota bacterium]
MVQSVESSLNPAEMQVGGLIRRARAAQKAIESYDQGRVDVMVAAVSWAILEPRRNRLLADLAVQDSGIGNADDKFAKNFRKTLGLMRDLAHAKSVGVLRHDAEQGITEIARPVGVVAAITPSTNPGATPMNKILNALKCRNSIIVAPSPKGASTCQKLLEFVHAQLDRVGAPRDLVQMLPLPGSQANIRAAYSSGTPAFGVGAGNVAVIIDEYADTLNAAAQIQRSKTFDNATSCSSENGVVIVESVYSQALAALQSVGGVLLTDSDRLRLREFMFPAGRLSSAATAQSASTIAARAGLETPGAREAKFLMVLETDAGPDHVFSGEKLSPVLAVWRVADFEAAISRVASIYRYQGAGHSVGLHTAASGEMMELRAQRLAQDLPVARVILNQAHAIATGGSFDNGLPFSLSMGCGTWGRNSFSDNMNYRHYMNITRIARRIPEVVPSVEELLAPYFDVYGK